jgi:hypothetical protein
MNVGRSKTVRISGESSPLQIMIVAEHWTVAANPQLRVTRSCLYTTDDRRRFIEEKSTAGQKVIAPEVLF